MAIVTLTSNRWLYLLFPKGPAPKTKKRNKKGFVYRFCTKHRPVGRNGPGRKTKRLKNGGVTSLHSNTLGVR